MGTDSWSVYVRIKVHQGWTYEFSRCHDITTGTIKHNITALEERRQCKPSAVVQAEPTMVQTLRES
jgi:hypothetical protein